MKSLNLFACYLSKEKTVRKKTVFSTHQNPEEVRNLEGILEEDEVNKVKHEARTTEPEIVVWGLDHLITIKSWLPLSNINSQLSYDKLQLPTHNEKKLHHMVNVKSVDLKHQSF